MNAPKTLWDYLPFFLGGIPVTLEITLLAMAVALPVSVVLALGRSSPHATLRWPAGFVIELFRGSSALVQLFWAFYVLPLFGISLPPLLCGVLVLGLNEGSYMSEVVRAGLDAVPKGQREAAVALGLPPRYRLFRIILPQALPLMVPPFGNELITMLKFTALVSLVTIKDLSFRASLIGDTLGESGPIFGLTIVVYFVLALILGGLMRLLERWVARRAGRHLTTIAAPHSTAFASGAPSPIPAWATGGGG
ncbi:MAG: ectoine/hydroxyectoine ABC transporter permease subunit EhuC [Alphaproteobacteria bacterium]|nr:ectoine/hydroxyectoine ABC transporter permease subunit EhuC [Alphaproteobacteria bacterium]